MKNYTYYGLLKRNIYLVYISIFFLLLQFILFIIYEKGENLIVLIFGVSSIFIALFLLIYLLIVPFLKYKNDLKRTDSIEVLCEIEQIKPLYLKSHRQSTFINIFGALVLLKFGNRKKNLLFVLDEPFNYSRSKLDQIKFALPSKLNICYYKRSKVIITNAKLNGIMRKQIKSVK